MNGFVVQGHICLVQKKAVCKKQVHQDIFNRCFWLKYKSHSHNIDLFRGKVVSSESGEKYGQLKHRSEVKTAQNSCKQICWWILKWDWRQTSLMEALLWITDSYVDQMRWLTCLNNGFVSYKQAAFRTRYWLLWCFISCLDFLSDGTHSLQRIQVM